MLVADDHTKWPNQGDEDAHRTCTLTLHGYDCEGGVT